MISLFDEIFLKFYEVAKGLGQKKGLVGEFWVEELKNAGFRDVASTVVIKAIWAENPYDRIPVAGDMQYFCIIQAEK